MTNPYISQKWNGSFFDDTSLFELGVSFQLGHDIGVPCPLPSNPINLVLFDLSGTHTLQVRYCQCDESGGTTNRRCQLLRVRWFPATWSRPRSAFTFRLLDFLHKLQTQSKVNLYDVYASLISLTNSAGQKPPVVRMVSLLVRMISHPFSLVTVSI
jgi:hypothetical protein